MIILIILLLLSLCASASTSTRRQKQKTLGRKSPPLRPQLKTVGLELPVGEKQDGRRGAKVEERQQRVSDRTFSTENWAPGPNTQDAHNDGSQNAAKVVKYKGVDRKTGREILNPTKNFQSQAWNIPIEENRSTEADPSQKRNGLFRLVPVGKAAQARTLKEAFQLASNELLIHITTPAYVRKHPVSCPVLHNLYLRHQRVRANCFDSSVELGCPETAWFKLASEELKRVKAAAPAGIGDAPESAGTDPKLPSILENNAKDIDNLRSENVLLWGDVGQCVEDLVRVDNLQTIEQFISHGLILESQLARNSFAKIACSSGAVETLTWMHSRWPEAIATQENVDAAVSNGQISVLDLMASVGISIVPSQGAVDGAAGTLGLETLQKWCHAWGIFPTQDGTDQAAKNGHFLTLQWLSKDRGIIPTQKSANQAAENGHLHTLQWMFEDHSVLPTQKGADRAAENGHLHVLKWMFQEHKILPTRDGANLAAKRGHLHVLQWMFKGHYIRLTRDGANWAAANGHLHILQWMLKEHNAPPTQEAVGRAAIYGHLLMRWLFKEFVDVLPTQDGANQAAGNGHLHILRWVAEEHKILPSKFGANLAAKRGHLHVLQWMFKEHNVLPTQDGINLAAQHGHLHVLQWMFKEHTVLPTQDGANLVAASGYLPVLQWLSQQNILPTQYGANQAVLNGHHHVERWIRSKLESK